MKKFIIGAGAMLLPLAVFAQQNAPRQPNLTNIEALLTGFGRLFDRALPILVTLALVFFFYALARFILAAGDEETRKTAKHQMIWGIVALFVMVSVWGLVGFLGQALGINQGETITNVPGVRNVGNR